MQALAPADKPAAAAQAAEKAQARLDDALTAYLTGTLEPAQKAYNEHYVCDYPLGLAGLDQYRAQHESLVSIDLERYAARLEQAQRDCKDRFRKDLGDVLDPPGGDPGQVHLDHGLLDGGLTALVALDDRRREPHALELGHPEGHLARGGREPALVVSGAVGLAPCRPLVAVGAYQIVGLLLEKGVQGVLDCSSDELPELAAHGGLVDDTMGSDMALPPNMIESRQLESYRRPEPCLLVSRLCCCESAQEIVRYPLVHDMENGHNRLVRELGLRSERHNSKLIKRLPDPENPLAAVNRLCYLLRLFLDSHTGFDRTRLGGYLDLFWVMMNPPRDKMEKAAFVLDRAMRNPKTLRYRDFYARSPSSDDEESSS